MAAIWLVFLGFPLYSAVTGDRHWVVRLSAVVTIIVFAGVYLRAFVKFGLAETAAQVNRLGWRHLAALVTLATVVGLLMGPEALGMATFVVALAMFSLGLRAAVAVTLGTTAVVILVPLGLGVLDDTWTFVPLVLVVAMATAVVRVLEDRQRAHRQAQEESALAEERDRVARDVHDVLGHTLTVVTVKAELAQRLVDDDPERAKAELAEIRSLSRQSLAEIRATVAGLRVARLPDELDSAATALAGAGIAAELPGDPAVVDPQHRIVLAWAVREAVTNVVRHSGATRCRVELGENLLTVTDDGSGAFGRPEGNGLRGLRERVLGVGGEVRLQSGPDGVGTQLQVLL
ncbi:MAG: sensor histidine kinase [Nocardioides sp.]